jgi:hypothetical protein
METFSSQPALLQDCLDKLSHALDLVLKTTEAASAENNHKLVIQSAREVTRIVALMHKMTSNTSKSGRPSRPGLSDANIGAPCASVTQPASRPQPGAKHHPDAGQNGRNPEARTMPDQETLFTPAEMAYWDYLPDKVSEKFCKEYRELQALEREVAAFLRNTNQKKGATT